MSAKKKENHKFKRHILVADDHALLLDTLKLAIESGDFQVTTCQSRGAVLENLKNDKDAFELVLLDVRMPDMYGMQSVLEVVKFAAPIPVALLSSGVSDAFALESLQNGVRGYVPKDTKLTDLHDIIKTIIGGGAFIPASMFLSKADETKSWGLSPREKMICPLISRGFSNKEISQKLQISEATVKMHIRAIFRKMGASNRTQVATFLNKTDLV